MKRVLSLLLLIPFLVTQAWAIRGGPFESSLGNSQASLAGTYGISLQGTEVAGANSISTTGILVLSVPVAGLVKGALVIFDKGLMYVGTSFGNLDSKSGKMRLLAQASHYAVIAIQNTMYTPVVDYNLSGQVNLDLSVDYLSGLIMASGNATFARSEPLAPQVTNNTATNAANKSATANNGATATTTAGTSATAGSSSATSLTNGSLGSLGSASTDTRGALKQISTTLTFVNEAGETQTETTTRTAGTTGPDLTSSQSATLTQNTTQLGNLGQNTTQQGNTGQSSVLGATTSQTSGTTGQTAQTDINAIRHNSTVEGGTTVKDSTTVSVASTAGLQPGMAVSGPGIPNGTTIVKVIDGKTVQLSKPATASATGVSLAANSDSVIFLTMTAEGMREETTVSALPVFTPPSTQVFQIGVNQTGVTGGAGGGAAGAGA